MVDIRRMLLIAALSCTSVVGWAQEPVQQRGALPDFPVTTLGGKQSSSLSNGKAGRWLLIYVRKDCQTCDDFLRNFRKEEDNPGTRVVVVVGGATTSDVADLKSRVPGLEDATWLAEKQATASTALKVKGTPTVFGMLDNQIKWMSTGVVAGQNIQKSILTSWIKPPKGNAQ